MPDPRPLWLRDPLAILAEGDAGGGIVVAGGRIVELVPARRPRRRRRMPRVFDASAHVVLPGPDQHAPSFLPDPDPRLPAGAGQGAVPLAGGPLPDLGAAHARAPAPGRARGAGRAAALRHDHHQRPPLRLQRRRSPTRSTSRSRRRRPLGMRLVATRGSMSLGEDEGGLPPRSVVQREDAILADSERLIGRYHEPDAGAMIQVALAPCSPFSVTESLMRDSGRARRAPRRAAAHPPRRDAGRGGLVPGAVRLPAGRLSGAGRLARRPRLAGARHLVRRGRDRPPRPRQGRGQPLPDLEHDPGLGLLPGRPAGGAPAPRSASASTARPATTART